MPPFSLLSFFLLIRRPQSSTLFPYTTLFRSQWYCHDSRGFVNFEASCCMLVRLFFLVLLVICLTCTAIITDRKSTRLNSSHANISYAVFCLKKKKQTGSRTKKRQAYIRNRGS